MGGLYDFTVKSAKKSARNEPLTEAEESLEVVFEKHKEDEWKEITPAHLSPEDFAEYKDKQGFNGDEKRRKLMQDKLEKFRIIRSQAAAAGKD